MKFARIEMLWMIWAVPVLLMIYIYGFRKRRRVLKHFSSFEGLKSIISGQSENRRRVKAGLLLICLFLTGFAVTGPQYGYKWQEVERRGIDIIIALDCSRSMLARDLNATRLDRAKREVFDLLNMLQGDRIGLVAFAGTAYLQCPLTMDYEAFYLFLNSLTPDYLPVGGTDIAGAITTSLSSFNQKSTSDKAIILITDGESTGKTQPQKAAEQAMKQGVKLFCIGIGKASGVPVPEEKGGFKKDSSGKIVLTKLDEETLKEIAVMTGGAYVRSVIGDMDLEAIYLNEIRGKMETAALTSGKKKVWENRYQWFLGLAILVFIIELMISPGKKTASILSLLMVFMFCSPVRAGTITDGLEAYQNNNYETALKLFIDAQLNDPDNPELLYNIGNAYYRLGNFEAAYNHYKQALKSENIALKQKSLYNMGNAGYRRGMLENAIQNYENALKIDPDDEKARQNIEFVKNVMEKKKEQKDEKDPSDNKDDNKNDDSDKNKDEPSKENPEDRQDNKNREDQNKKQEPGDTNPETGRNKDKGKETDQQQKTAGDKQDPNDQKKNEDEQANRMLNRLQDKPGKAMMPVYKKRRVEKDW